MSTESVPKLFGLYHEQFEAGTLVAFLPVAWALELAGGQAVTVTVTKPPSVTLWPSLEDAREALDAHIDEIDPRPARHVMGTTP